MRRVLKVLALCLEQPATYCVTKPTTMFLRTISSTLKIIFYSHLSDMYPSFPVICQPLFVNNLLPHYIVCLSLMWLFLFLPPLKALVFSERPTMKNARLKDVATVGQSCLHCADAMYFILEWLIGERKSNT